MRLYASFSTVPLEISGSFWLSGPQYEDQIPDEIVNLFKSDSEIVRVSLEKEKHHVVYQKMDK
jgi:hypothetical protein